MRKYFFKAVIAIFGSAYISFLLQTSVFSRFGIAGISPNLLLIVACMFGFMLGSKFGMVAGFFCGLLLDVFTGSYFGMNCIIYMYIGLLNGIFSTFFFGDDVKLPILLIAGSDVLVGLVIYGIFFFLNGNTNIIYYLTNIIIPEAVYTVLVSLAYYYPFKQLCAWVDKEEKRGTRVIG